MSDVLPRMRKEMVARTIVITGRPRNTRLYPFVSASREQIDRSMRPVVERVECMPSLELYCIACVSLHVDYGLSCEWHRVTSWVNTTFISYEPSVILRHVLLARSQWSIRCKPCLLSCLLICILDHVPMIYSSSGLKAVRTTLSWQDCLATYGNHDSSVVFSSYAVL